MKTKYKHRRLTLLGYGFFLALLISAFRVIYAEDQRVERPAVEPQQRKDIKRTELPVESDNSRDAVHLVGPSGEEIHDFLYPTPANRNVVTSTN